jgi:hypothetical protein
LKATGFNNEIIILESLSFKIRFIWAREGVVNTTPTIDTIFLLSRN